MQSLIHWINRAIMMFACLFMLLMMGHITADVALRFFFNGRLIGTLEIVSYYYMVVIVFLSLGYVELRGEHIRVDLFAQMMPHAVQLGLYVFACTLGLIFFGMLGWQTLQDAISATARSEEAMSNYTFYIWPARWALPLGFAGIWLAILSNLLKSVATRRAL
ncbi:C4-dicarboxylate ABC transporter permease [Thioclava sp. SK-1]|uniref:TRAP transporter small permease subunit n=1 Tax=Thioclava sp. SK-1 TaxID=1889770 RepID=UPI0008267432|nr:TRAP transporter small permease [Thioclava sp. SK-1]OCX63796.1 C4-dicarboxylate ABC transporter permease [Thioclava sp. SK-1]